MSRTVIDTLKGLTRRTGSMSYVTFRHSGMAPLVTVNDWYKVSRDSTGQVWTGTIVAISHNQQLNGNEVSLVCVRFEAGAEPGTRLTGTTDTFTVTLYYRNGSTGQVLFMETENINIYSE